MVAMTKKTTGLRLAFTRRGGGWHNSEGIFAFDMMIVFSEGSARPSQIRVMTSKTQVTPRSRTAWEDIGSAKERQGGTSAISRPAGAPPSATEAFSIPSPQA